MNEFLKYADANEFSEDMYNALVERVLVHNSGIEVGLIHML